MSLKSKLEKLSAESGSPSVSIALNTHRTKPDYELDIIALKNLMKDAEKRLMDSFSKKEIEPLLEKLTSLSEAMDKGLHLDSLHIFASNQSAEMITINMPIKQNYVHVGKRFSLRPILKAFLATRNYFVLVLSQGGVHLYEALNDELVDEVKNDYFPFSENQHYITDNLKRSDTKQLDNMVREFFNKVDKAVQLVYNNDTLPFIVISAEHNYRFLREVADNPSIYKSHIPINYNQISRSQLGKQAWGAIERLNLVQEENAIKQIEEAVSKGCVLTDLQEIYQAAIDGKARRLIVQTGFQQPVVMTSDRTFDYVRLPVENGVDDIIDDIAWHVFSGGGDVIFTTSKELIKLGNVVLETRY